LKRNFFYIVTFCFTLLFLHGKNNFGIESKRILLDTDLKINLLEPYK